MAPVVAESHRTHRSAAGHGQAFSHAPGGNIPDRNLPFGTTHRQLAQLAESQRRRAARRAGQHRTIGTIYYRPHPHFAPAGGHQFAVAIKGQRPHIGNGQHVDRCDPVVDSNFRPRRQRHRIEPRATSIHALAISVPLARHRHRYALPVAAPLVALRIRDHRLQ